MSVHHFPPRPRSRRGSLAALDFGLRVRVEAHLDQRTIFSGAENLSAQELTSELGEMVSWIRVRSFALCGELEQVTSALMVNVQCGFWPLARCAAEDLAALLREAAHRHLADAELCQRGTNGAWRIAELCREAVQ